MRELKKSSIHVKSDERILGDGDFVSQILLKAEESFERHRALKATKIDIESAAKGVSTLLNIPRSHIRGG